MLFGVANRRGILTVGFISDLDAKLLQLSSHDYFTLRDACEGVQVFGGLGSGKTSGSGRALASAYLRAGFGGLVLTAKPDEVEQWIGYAHANGRADSVVLFGERGGGFNFIDYELARHGADGIGSVVECLMRALEAARLTNPNAGRASEGFWEDSSRQLLRNTLPILHAAHGEVRIPDIIRFIQSAPVNHDQLHSDEWQAASFMFQSLLAAARAPRYPLPPDEFEKISYYWRYEYSQLDPKTRGNIAISLSTTLDRFHRGRLQRAFCGATDIVPELTFHGAIVIMDMPALTWNEDGIIGQQLFKYAWQRAVLARNALAPQHRERPVFCFADESQFFVNSFDADFQSSCRSSRACTVYLTQSLPTYYARMAGHDPQHQADMLLANFGTRVFHSSACRVTNSWAADTIGRTIQRRGSYNEGRNYGSSRGMSDGGGWSAGRSWGVGSSRDQRGGNSVSSNSGGHSGASGNWGRNRGLSDGGSYGTGYSEAMDYEIEPGAFASELLTGGPANRGTVTGLWFQAGKTFRDSDRNFLVTRFQQ